MAVWMIPEVKILLSLPLYAPVQNDTLWTSLTNHHSLVHRKGRHSLHTAYNPHEMKQPELTTDCTVQRLTRYCAGEDRRIAC